MRCPHDGCRKRFKGHVGDNCPVCDQPAKVDPWASKRPWRAQLCYCDGMWWSIRGAPHKIGTGECKYSNKRTEE